MDTETKMKRGLAELEPGARVRILKGRRRGTWNFVRGLKWANGLCYDAHQLERPTDGFRISMPLTTAREGTIWERI